MPIQQGNFLPAEAASHIQVGMSEKKLINKLGDPVLTNIYKDHRVIYVYTLRPAHRWHVSFRKARNSTAYQKNAYLRKQLIVVLKNKRVVSYHFDSNQAAKDLSIGEW